MGRKRWLSVLLIASLMLGFIMPAIQANAESEWEKIDRKLQEVKREKQEAAQRSKTIDNQIDKIESEQKKIEQEVVSIEQDIKETEQKIFSLEKEISLTTEEVKLAAEQLEAAEKRVAKRNELLKTRVRLMYKNGSVKYLEVLLGANSFSDFLLRFEAIQKIISSDKKILEDNIKDRNMVAKKKQEIEKQLAKLEGLYAEAEQLKVELTAKRNKHLVTIASLDEKKEELNEALQEEEKMLRELAAKEEALMKQQYDLQYKGGFFAWPVPASKRITSPFGMRIHPITGEYKGHHGIDIGRAPSTSTLYGADIVAAQDGIVLVATYVSGYGNTIIINHGGGIWTLYGHIREGGLFVKAGQKVKKGQKIAEVGSTGRSTGPHLHFEVRENQVPVNPMKYFQKR